MSKNKHPAEGDKPDVVNPGNPDYRPNDNPQANQNDPILPAHKDRQGSKGGSPSAKKPS